MRNLISIFLICLFSVQGFAYNYLKNKAPLLAEMDRSLPRNILLLSFQGGPAVLPESQQGIIAILKEVLKDGPANKTMAQFKQELFELGAEIEVISESNMFEVILLAPPDETEKALGLLKQTLENPRISEEDFKEYHAKVLAGLKAKFEDMRKVIFYFAPRDFLGPVKQLRVGDTSPATFEKITFHEFKQAIPKVLDFQSMFASSIGPTDPKSIDALLNSTFAEQLKKPYKRWKAEQPKVPKLAKNTCTLIDKPGATDNQILFIFPQKVERDSSQWPVSQITMDLLGGGLHGRLGKTLRSERGLTYSASSGFSSTLLPYWLAWTFGGLEQTKPLLAGVPEVIAAYKKAEITQEELSESKARLLNNFKTGTELPKDRLSMQGWYYGNGLPYYILDRYPKRLQQASMKTVGAFRKALQSQSVAIYVMGDKSKVLPMLEAVGIEKDQVKVVPVAEIQ
jgi:predicted Zn-dependent peptidase